MCGLKRIFFRNIASPLFLLGVLFFFFIIYAKLFNPEIKDLFSTLAGAFFGTGAAFVLKLFQSHASRKEREKASLIKTAYIINIICKFNDQLNTFINQYKHTREDYFDWEKISEYQHDMFIPHIETDHLTFLLDYWEKGKQTLDAILLVAAEQYDIKVILEKRNQMYGDYLNKTPNRDELTKELLEDILGLRVFHLLKELTEQLIKTNQNLIEDCKIANNKINYFLDSW